MANKVNNCTKWTVLHLLWTGSTFFSINTIDNRNKVVALLKEYFMQQNKKLLSFFYSPNCCRPMLLFYYFLMNLCTALLPSA